VSTVQNPYATITVILMFGEQVKTTQVNTE